MSKLALDFGKTTRWRLFCKERNAQSEEEKILIAEEILAEPPMGSVAAFGSHLARLHGAKQHDSPTMEETQKMIEWLRANAAISHDADDLIVGRFGTKSFRFFVQGGWCGIIETGGSWTASKPCYSLKELLEEIHNDPNPQRKPI